MLACSLIAVSCIAGAAAAQGADLARSSSATGGAGPAAAAAPCGAPAAADVPIGTFQSADLQCAGGSFPIYSLTHRVEREYPTTGSPGSQPGPPQFTLAFEKEFAECSIGLLDKLLLGELIAEAAIQVGAQHEIRLKDILVVEVQQRSSPCGLPRESISLVYDEIEWEWSGPGGSVVTGYDVGFDVGSGSAPADLKFCLPASQPPFPDQVEIFSLANGFSYDSSGSGGSPVVHDELRVTKRLDELTPQLLFAAAAGSDILNAEIDLKQPDGGSDVSWLLYELSQVNVAAIELSREPAGEIRETLDLRYESFTLSHFQYHVGN